MADHRHNVLVEDRDASGYAGNNSNDGNNLDNGLQ